jgi:hypothetical protein
VLRLLESVDLLIDDEAQVAALEHLRHLSHLRRIGLKFCEVKEAALPPFIPPSLKALEIGYFPPPEPLLHELVTLLQASGARLETFGSWVPVDLSAEGGAAIAQVLRTCSSTLKTVVLNHNDGQLGSACSRELVSGLMSCCDTLEVLRFPWAVFSALPTTCPTFPPDRAVFRRGTVSTRLQVAGLGCGAPRSTARPRHALLR